MRLLSASLEISLTGFLGKTIVNVKGIENWASKENLREQWKKLHALDDASQEHGYQLEELILELLKLETLNPAPPWVF
jgi:hypothetical protein